MPEKLAHPCGLLHYSYRPGNGTNFDVQQQMMYKEIVAHKHNKVYAGKTNIKLHLLENE